MSHEATNWAIKQRGLKPATKIVLWHLCDRYNPDQGCFPRQDRLANDCEMSRSTLNVHLKALEDAGLIARQQRIDEATNRQLSTRYLFAFEEGFEPCPKTGHGAVSENEAEPSPDLEQSRVRNPDTNPVIEPVREPIPPTPEPVEPPKGEGDFSLIWKGWPEGKLPDNRDYAEKLFDALGPEDRASAVAMVETYLVLCAKRQRQPQLVTYLREKLFRELDGAPETDKDGDFIITPKCAEWRPWIGAMRKQHGEKGVDYFVKLGRMAVKTRYPEGFQNARH
jgi:hypothetical protein